MSMRERQITSVRDRAGRAFWSALAGTAAGLVALACLAAVAHVALSPARLDRIVRDAAAVGDLDYPRNRNEDFFSECSLLIMIRDRNESTMRDVLETRWARPAAGEHPCTTLQRPTGQAEPTSYVNYPYGSRFLAALVLSFVKIGDARGLYSILSYAALAALFLGVVTKSRRAALMIAPAIGVLLFSFSLHHFGGNLAHAPGFIIGFLGLAIFMAAPRWFHDRSRRIAFFAFLGTLVAGFDLLHGAMVTTLSLAIVLNHFFHENAGGRGWRESAVDVGVLLGCFLLGYACLTAARLSLLEALYGFGLPEYVASLSPRIGNTAAELAKRVALSEVAGALWRARFQLTPGGFLPATWLLCASLAAWIFAVALLVPALLRKFERASSVAIDLAVLAVAASGIVVWWTLFAAHTYIHALFAIRLLAIPAALGFAAAGLALSFSTSAGRGYSRLVPLTAVASLVVAVAGMNGFWEAGSAEVRAAFVSRPADRVSCARLGMAEDGKPDGLIAISYLQLRAPLDLQARSEDLVPTHIRLERYDPHGEWDTSPAAYILGVSAEFGGPLINAADGSIRRPARGSSNFWVHFCRDGADRPDSRYRLSVDDFVVDLSQ
ncbi:MAG TPA: hypothetical protein VF601_24205 [Beijerinckiaceae bacterium]|jgi:hypothetical protein